MTLDEKIKVLFLRVTGKREETRGLIFRRQIYVAAFEFIDESFSGQTLERRVPFHQYSAMEVGDWYKGVFCSSDGGKTWRYSPEDDQLYRKGQLEVSPPSAPASQDQETPFREALSKWDATRIKNALADVDKKRLPIYVIPYLIQYGERDSRPEVHIPFRYDPIPEEVRAVAASLYQFIVQHTQEHQQVISISGGIGGDMQYFVRSLTEEGEEGQSPVLTAPTAINYRVAKTSAFDIPGAEGMAQGAVTISREFSCRHDPNTLEAYVQAVKSQR